MRTAYPLLMAGALALGIGAVQAATATDTFTVSATVDANCLVSAGTLDFGTYTPNITDVTSTATITVNCTQGTGYTVRLNAGMTLGSTVGQRLLANGANTLQYNLFRDAGHTQVWGVTDGTDTEGGTGAGIPTDLSHTVYGQLLDSAFNQAVPTGTYNDTITVTVFY
jgi:spore coat protein U-like protein